MISVLINDCFNVLRKHQLATLELPSLRDPAGLQAEPGGGVLPSAALPASQQAGRLAHLRKLLAPGVEFWTPLQLSQTTVFGLGGSNVINSD